MEYIPNKNIVAKHISAIFKTGEVVNLGIGLPTLVEKYLPHDVTIALQSENGIMGIGPAPAKGSENRSCGLLSTRGSGSGSGGKSRQLQGAG